MLTYGVVELPFLLYSATKDVHNMAVKNSRVGQPFYLTIEK
jgi:hypothetical protein